MLTGEIVTHKQGSHKISFAIWARLGYNPAHALAPSGRRFTMFSGRGQPKEDT